MALPFPDIDPIAFSLGPLAVRWYALAYLAGFLLGWRYCMRLAGFEELREPTKETVDDFLPWAILGVILGGRFGYVLFYQFEYYAAYPMDALKIWEGGMSFHGGVLGVAVSLVLYPVLKKFNPLRLSDLVCAAAPIGLFFGRIANFINAELWGRVTDVPWAFVFPNAGSLPRHPSQLYEAALEGGVLFFILFALVRMQAIRNRPGIVTGVFLIGYGVFRSFIELFRQPDAHLGFILDGISMGQILSVPMIVAGLVFIGFALMKKTTHV